MRLMIAFLALIGFSAAGCVVHPHPHHGAVVVIPVGHVHSEHCGHYHYRGGWYYAEGHHHGPGCGHIHRDGVWVFVD